MLATFFLVNACANSLSPQQYLSTTKTKIYRNKIAMDGYLHLKPTEVVFDSLQVVKNVLNNAFSCKKSVLIIVYFNGPGPKDVMDAIIAGNGLRNELVKMGYPEKAISYKTKFFIPNPPEKIWVYKKIDFVLK